MTMNIISCKCHGHIWGSEKDPLHIQSWYGQLITHEWQFIILSTGLHRCALEFIAMNINSSSNNKIINKFRYQIQSICCQQHKGVTKLEIV